MIVSNLYDFFNTPFCKSISSENNALIIKDMNYDTESNPTLVFYKLQK